MRRKAQEWIYNLSDEDITFIKNFVMSSGSLKEVAKLYQITYPAVRLRLDRLIQKMQMNDQIENDAYISLIKKMVIDDQLDFDTAKILIKKYIYDNIYKGKKKKMKKVCSVRVRCWMKICLISDMDI